MFRLSIIRKQQLPTVVATSATKCAVLTTASSLISSNEKNTNNIKTSALLFSTFATTSATSTSTTCFIPAITSQFRFCSSSTTTSSPPLKEDPEANTSPSSASSTSVTTEAEQLDQLFEEVSMLLDEPLPIGTLFKALSAESRNYVSSKRLSFETFLLRYPQKFQVFKQLTHRDRNIYVCKTGSAPAGANHAQEVAGTTVGAHAIHTGGVTDGARARIYTVLKYIPNEWASYVALPIPDDVKKKIIKKPAKSFFERNPRYFEVRFNPNMGHTFEVRRSTQLQEFMKQKSQMEGRK